MRKLTYTALLILFTLISLGLLVSCTNTTNESKRQEETKDVEIDLILKSKEQLILKYNPIVLPLQSEDAGLYTLQLQEKLIGDRPVIFLGQIVDIWKFESQVYVEFDAMIINIFDYDDESLYSNPFWLSTDKIVLQCSYSSIEKYLNIAPKMMFGIILNPEKFYVIAQIDSLTKTDYKVVGRPEDEDSVSLELEVSDQYVVTGKLIELVNLNNAIKLATDPLGLRG